jgi:hypothetical protein
LLSHCVLGVYLTLGIMLSNFAAAKLAIKVSSEDSSAVVHCTFRYGCRDSPERL